jgi:hypothetical protein
MKTDSKLPEKYIFWGIRPILDNKLQERGYLGFHSALCTIQITAYFQFNTI